MVCFSHFQKTRFLGSDCILHLPFKLRDSRLDPSITEGLPPCIVVDEVKYVAVTWLLCEQLCKKSSLVSMKFSTQDHGKLYSKTVPIFCERSSYTEVNYHPIQRKSVNKLHHIPSSKIISGYVNQRMCEGKFWLHVIVNLIDTTYTL